MAAATSADASLDVVSRLHLAASELCGEYTNAMGNLQNEADKRMMPGGSANSAHEERAVQLAAEGVIQAHRQLETLGRRLEREFRSEEAQLKELHDLQSQHVALTEELREETAHAGMRPRYCADPCRCL